MNFSLFAPLAFAAALLSTAATAAPRPPHHPSRREQARWEAQHHPAPRPTYHYHRGEPLPTHRVARLPLHPAPAGPGRR